MAGNEVKVDIITSDDIKIYYTGKFQYFTARYVINLCNYSNFEILHILFGPSYLLWPVF